MEFRPILSAMMRNKLGAFLIAAQIAVTMAILCNGAFLAYQRVALMSRDTGMDIHNIFSIDTINFGTDYNHFVDVERDLEAIRAIPGVKAATSINQVPLSGGGWGDGVRVGEPEDSPRASGNVYFVDQQGIDTLGVKLIAGRPLTRDDMIERLQNSSQYPEVVVVTRRLADELFPDEEAVGKTVYKGDSTIQIVGVVEKMQGAWLGWDDVENVMIYPGRLETTNSRFLIRAEPGMRDSTMPLVEEALAARYAQRVVRELTTLEEHRAGSYSGDRTVAVVLMVVMALLIGVTGLGIVGLASFLVNQRRKQVGTRRALGAQRFHIIRYFLVENWLITTIGLSVGLLLTITLNYWMVSAFELPRLDWIYIPIGLALIWTMGLFAALGPARRASRVSPAIATRTV